MRQGQGQGEVADLLSLYFGILFCDASMWLIFSYAEALKKANDLLHASDVSRVSCISQPVLSKSLLGIPASGCELVSTRDSNVCGWVVSVCMSVALLGALACLGAFIVYERCSQRQPPVNGGRNGTPSGNLLSTVVGTDRPFS